MYTRKVIQSRKSLLINLPKEIAEDLGVKKGDTCEILISPGFGAVVRKVGGKGGSPAPIDEVYRGMSAARIAAQEFRRQVGIIAAKTGQRMEMVLTGKAVEALIRNLGQRIGMEMDRMSKKDKEPMRAIYSNKEREKKARRIITRPRKKRARP